MRALISTVMASVAFLALVQWTVADDAAEKADLEKFKGTWEFESVTDKGRKETPPPGIEIVFDGNSMSVKMGGHSQKRTIKLNPSTNPKRIDTIADDGPMKGTVEPGIYEVTADQIKMCVSVAEIKSVQVDLDVDSNPKSETVKKKVGKRPAAFDDKQGAIIILKRKAM